MLQFEELRLELLSYEDKLKDLAEALGLQKMKDEVAELEAESAKDGFWDDIQRSQKISLLPQWAQWAFLQGLWSLQSSTE